MGSSTIRSGRVDVILFDGFLVYIYSLTTNLIVLRR